MGGENSATTTGDCWKTNTTAQLQLDDAALKFLQVAATRLGWSGRSTHRALKVARTIADLAGAHSTQVAHVAEAMQYRQALRGAL